MNEALRIAEYIDFPSVHLGHEAAAELRRLYDLHGKANALCRIRAERIKELEALNAELVEALQIVAGTAKQQARAALANSKVSLEGKEK